MYTNGLVLSWLRGTKYLQTIVQGGTEQYQDPISLRPHSCRHGDMKTICPAFTRTSLTPVAETGNSRGITSFSTARADTFHAQSFASDSFKIWQCSFTH
ncbi:hypothetical protein PILCRDRAFT_583062 [Piloderma croceum F 1598]|uniref:Uncharacterized protein n=1 Tax=Piloderma croceum (strain F 1598) TaxID=765440 RepID=A0A0C3BN51_PILCF|nr:hypothetical protein PILCRDRAFT_583062 [Piloderma croceum F 1598]